MTSSHLAGGEAVDDALPELFLARLGAAQTLQQLVELHRTARRHEEGGARVTHDRHELVVLGGRDVVHALVRALCVPGETGTFVKKC